MADPQIVGILPAQLDKVWPEVLPLIDAACERGGRTSSPEHLLTDLRSGALQLWLAVSETVEAVFVTEVVKRPLRTVADVLIGTGSGYERWYDRFIAVFEAWARAQGADRVRLVARPGWQRVVRHLGYSPTHVVLEKDLNV